ncbi:hypothetical protein KUCAC02_035962, partial [Chaenocephalus aceratus]
MFHFLRKNNTSEKVKETRSKPCSISSGRVPDAAAAAKPCSETRTGRTAWIYRLFRPTQNNTSEKVKETRSKPCSISSGRVPDAAAAAKPCSETRTGRTAWIYRLFRPTQKKSGAESGPQKSVAHVPEQCINQLCVSISPRPTGSDSCWIFPCFR